MCRRFRGTAAYGYDHARRHKFYGFRLHLRTTREGLIPAFDLAAAAGAGQALVAELRPLIGSIGIGDRNYWAPDVQQALRDNGVSLLAAFRAKSRDPDPAGARVLSRLRWRIETAIGPRCARFRIQRPWAKDLGPLCHRLLRKALRHTLRVQRCRERGLAALPFAQLLAA